MPFGNAGTFAYTPDVKVYISTTRNGFIDVSDDVMSFTVTRQVNATSSASVILTNKDWKYTPAGTPGAIGTEPPIIETMDRIIILLKRTTYLQVFSGFVTSAPIIGLIPSPIQITANCTLYRLQNVYWDASIPQFQALVPGILEGKDISNAVVGYGNDGGVAQSVRDVLSQVAYWPLSNIHISALPNDWITYAENIYNNDIVGNSATSLSQNSTVTLMQLLDGAGIAAGANLLAQDEAIAWNNPTTSNGGAVNQSLVEIPYGQKTYAYAVAYNRAVSSTKQDGVEIIGLDNTELQSYIDQGNTLSPGNCAGKDAIKNPQWGPVDFWSIIPWPYSNEPNINSDARNTARDWLSEDSNFNEGRPILLTNTQNGNQVVVRASITAKVPPGGKDAGIGLSRAAWEALAGPVVTRQGVNRELDFYYSNVVPVTCAFVDTTSSLITPGVQNSTSLQQQLKAAGFNLNSSFPQDKPTNGKIVTTGQSSLITMGSSTTVNDQNGTNVAASAVSYALTQLGKPYSWGYGHSGSGTTPTGFDCSGLVDWSYSKAGLNFGGKGAEGLRTDTDMPGRFIPVSELNQNGVCDPNGYGIKVNKLTNTLRTGDLIFWMEGSTQAQHVMMYVGEVQGRSGVQVIQAAGGPDKNDTIGNHAPGSPGIILASLSEIIQYWVPGSSGLKAIGGIRRPSTGVTDEGRGSTTMTSTTLASGVTPGNINNNTVSVYGNLTPTTQITTSVTGTTGASTNISSTGNGNFNFEWTNAGMDTKALWMFGSPRAFISDVPVLSSISTLITTSLRDFQSAPNGDFVAWYPDYFGLYGTAPTIDVYDIEILDFKIQHDDNYLVTHVGVAGDPFFMGQGVQLADWISSNGIVSLQIPEIMAYLFKGDKKATDSLFGNQAINFLNRYGMRPIVQEQPMIQSHLLEFMYAWQLFLLNWSQQYTTEVSFTFMPELYPGMRINLADHGIEVYVQSVTHQGSREGGFTTEAQVTCPITRDANGNVQIMHYGFPVS